MNQKTTLTTSARRGFFGSLLAGAAMVSAATLAIPAAYAATTMDDAAVTHHTVKVRGIDIHYREAGPATGPVVLLLHGFPSSSHMFRVLMPKLAAKYRVIAPDYPGFGYSGEPKLKMESPLMRTLSLNTVLPRSQA